MADIKLDPFSPAAAGSTSTSVTASIAYTLLNLKLKLTVITKAQLDEIKIYLGGEPIWEVTGPFLDAVNKYFRYTANAAYLTLWFGNPLARHSLAEFLRGALDMGYYGKKLQIDCKFNAAAGAGSKVEARADVVGAYPDKNLRGQFRSMNKAVQVPGGAVTEKQAEIYTRGDKGLDARALHAYGANVANITKINLTKDAAYLIQGATAADLQFSQNELTRTTQADHLCVYDAVLFDKDSMSTSTLRDDGKPAQFSLNYDTSAAGNFDLYTDGLRTL